MRTDFGVGQWLAVLGAVALTAGCAGGKQLVDGAGNGPSLRGMLSDYSYTEPLAEVWPQVTPVLEAAGYVVRPTDQESTVVTEWQQHLAGERLVFTRLLIQGFRLASGGSQIRAYRQTDNVGGAPKPIMGDMGKTNHASGMTVLLVPVKIARWVENGTLVRDVDLEWEILRKAEPDMASRIEAMIAYRAPSR